MSVRFCGIDWDDVRGDVFGSPECVCVLNALLTMTGR